ncbi:MAG: asparagine synthase (glutamine-hydrolyzing) [Eggerthellaceae bacterium]|nr:asparagine synthase (glutamine-hydrolyzing) [Eggerthellaceae bacterium]
MCGFVGFTGNINNKEQVMEAMLTRIVHRGPDMGDSFFTDDIAMGFRRLSILDLSEHGAQPMSNVTGDVVITFNGEIYNFAELRSELEAKGYKFHSGADTESLLHAYEEWGEDVVDHLRGMYAFVIWDKQQNKLFGARDIFGIKPLYYTRTSQGNLLWGSEIKSFLDHPDFIKEVNKEALRPYLTLQYSATTETFFKGVYKLEAAHCFTYDLATEYLDVRRYWDCDFSEIEKSFDEYVEEVDDVVHESVAAHRIADVKVGSFLSGGVDSSYITACLMPDNTFSVGFEDNGFNETNYASELSQRLGVKNFRKMISAQECFNALSDIQYHMDEPQSNLSSVPLYFLAQMASEQVTVVLSGEGADEIFGGYAWYEDNSAVSKAKKIPRPLRRAVGILLRSFHILEEKTF